MYCQYCGHEVNDDAKICLSCGCPTDNYRTTVPTATTTAQHQDSQVSVAGATATETDYSPKKGIVALILLLVLGQFGAHRFYVGRIGSAIGMMILFLSGYISMIVITYVKTILHEIYDSETEFTPTVDESLTSVFGLLLLLAWFIWWLVDLISLFSGKFRDGNGRVIKLS